MTNPKHTMIEVMDLVVQILMACLKIIQDRMELWQLRAATEERADIERTEGSTHESQSAQAHTHQIHGSRPKAFPPPAFVHSRPYFVPGTGKGKGNFKGKMKAKANEVAAECGGAPTQAFRFIELVMDAAATVDEEWV